ncbi:MAG: hypothetical protein BroJett021_33390 [Chloroflexota bacterium]|nr:MAG: hypothetical protein BroJett021_33390 [Chloroflexota bacterium]
MTPDSLIQNLSHHEVEVAAAEALAWRRGGVLQGDALRGIATRLVAEIGIPECDSLRMADSLIVEEAAARYVAHI